MEAYITHMLILTGIYAILTMGQNIVLGYTGLFGIAQAAFYGIGAYTSALLALKLGVPFWGGLLAGALMGGFMGWALGLCTMRLGGDYFCIVTLGFVVIVQQVLLNWEDLTRGAFGLPGIPRPSLFGFAFESRLSYSLLVWILVLILCILMYNISESRLGRAFKAIRDNEIGALGMGINTFQVKVLAVALGGFYAGVGGALYAHYTGYIDPSSFSVMETIIVLCMAVLGGMGSITGSILGTALLILVPELLRLLGITGNLSILRQLIYGLILVAAILLRPQGMIGRAEIRPLALITGGPLVKEV
jgi:branched-chain amino acid transport system permease protein